MQETFQTILKRSQAAWEDSFTPDQMAALEKIGEEILRTLRSGGKILLCGNGGSAADCQHIAAEFVGRFKRERRSLPAIALTTDTSILTAVGNDYGFDRIFSRQVEGLGARGDILIALSTSGNSINILEAVQSARRLEMATVGLTGLEGGRLAQEVDFCFSAQTGHTPQIQEIHIIGLHAVTEWVEARYPAS